MTRTMRRVLGLCTFSLLGVIRGCSQSDFTWHDAFKPAVMAASIPSAAGERLRQHDCADRVVGYLIRRDGIEPYVLSQEVQLDPRNRIRVFLRFRQEMKHVFPRLGRFVKYPRWLGGGRYASTYGRGQPGFELHIDPEDPARTVQMNAHKSSDVDEHEPAGDVASVVMHAINLLQHEMGQPEIPPCELLAHYQGEWRSVPRAILLERPAERRFYVDANMSALQDTAFEDALATERAMPLWMGVDGVRQQLK